MTDRKSQNSRIHFAHGLLRARDWQDRPEFGRLCRWWTDGGAGVCALVGIGGAGKTAIAERFLRVLPDVLPETEDVPKNNDLPGPEGLFVFSFYDVPNPDSFFAELTAWLTGPAGQSPRKVSYQQTLLLLQRAGSSLLVLDGLEKVQDDGARGGVFGQIQDKRLSDFVRRIASGYLPSISAIITTRFPIAELEKKMPPNYLPIDIVEISEKTGVDLLRQRGVKGRHAELSRIVNECGRHALTVDLVGGYIADLGGDKRLKLASADELIRAANRESDARLRNVIRQEYRFARIAERYREALAKRDKAALALLERVCLFRLGVDADTLASIFTGKGKAKISGLALARLSKEKLQAKLDLLVSMRLLEASEYKDEKSESKAKYMVHPAVREGFLKGMDAATARVGHEAAKEGLEASLGGRKEGYPSDPAMLDLQEEIVYHTHAAGHVQEAWDIYVSRIGDYENLGWRLGSFERGERICKVFANGHPPEAAHLPMDLSRNDQGAFINVWGLYLLDLGRLEAAVQCYERGIRAAIGIKEWRNASIGNRNLCDIFILAGRLNAGMQAAEKALGFAKRTGEPRQHRFSIGYRGFAHTLLGQTDAALNDFQNVLKWLHNMEGKTDRSLYGLNGIHYALLLTRLGQGKSASRLTEENQKHLYNVFGNQHRDIPNCNLVLADLARERDELAEARDLLEWAHEWAIARDAKEVLSWSALVRGKIAFDEAKKKKKSKGKYIGEARSSVDEGLRIARDCGYGIYHIDLLLVKARIELYEGNAGAAKRDIIIALMEGIHPPKESGLPTLLAAADPECGYAWGEGDARQLLAETLLLKAAQKLGREDFAIARFETLPADVKNLIENAREQLNKSAEIRKRIKDPKLSQTEETLEQLDGGVLTAYPVKTAHVAKAKAAVLGKAKKRTSKITAKESKRFRIALSFPGEQRRFVAGVAGHLSDAFGKEKIFYDKYYEAELARVDLDTYLQHIYHNQSELIVVFLCAEYERKKWCGLEWRAIRDLIADKQGSAIMPIRFDDKHIPGLFSVDGYVSVNNRSPEEISALIIERHIFNEQSKWK